MAYRDYITPETLTISDPYGKIARGWSNTDSNQPVASNFSDVLISVRYNG